MAMLLFVESLLWSIIGDSGFVVSSVVPSAQALLSLHLLTGKMGTRLFFHDFEQPLCYLTVHFPRAYVSLMRTTNLLERFQKEIRRKQRDIGMLQSAAGGDVLWYMVAMRETAKQRALCRGKG